MTTNPYRLTTDVVPTNYQLNLEPDLDTFTFEGRVTIALDVREPVRSLTLHALELELERGTVTAGSTTSHSAAPTFDETYETVTFAFEDELPVGPATFEVSFTGIINVQLHGLYRSTYVDADGVTHNLATTQFAPTDARRCFPCFDEPAMKATFDVTMTVARDLAVVSNSPVAKETELADGRTSFVFAPTMKMSTYLVAFVIGHVEATEPVTVRGVPVRVVYPLGKERLARACIDMAIHAVEFFSDYFAIPYPGDKLDLVAVPDFAAGAMENLGCIIFRETDLLIDLETAAQDEIERVALVVNHEIAHMWFGDLVTMDWWEGIWLNEAFATFMESLCTDHYRPEWKKWVGFIRDRDFAFSVDALHSTRPIEYEVVSPNDCHGMFDVLTYVKGCAVLRMLEQYLGSEVFRDGIRIYLERHAYANTVTNDLWAALEESSGQPVARIMDTWILQGGFPLVSVRDGNLSQTPFEALATNGPSAIGRDWMVPILSRPLSGGPRSSQLLGSEAAPLATSGPAVVNAGGSGFFRTAYGDAELSEIGAHLMELDEIERAVLFSDTWAAVMVGGASLSGLLGLATGLRGLDEPSSWRVIHQSLAMVDRIADEDGRAALARAALRIFGPELERLGWEQRDDETTQAGELRTIAVEALGTYGRDEVVITEALRRFDATELVGDLARPIITITAIANRPGTLATLDERRRSAATPQEEQSYLFAMAQVPDEASALEVFDRCLTDIRSQDAPYLVTALLGQRDQGPAVWRRLRDRWDEVLAYFPEGMQAFATLGVRGIIGDEGLAREIRAFHESHPLAAAQQRVLQALDLMDQGVAFARRNRPGLVEVLDGVARA